MIGLSALLASTVTLINMRETYINKVLDKSESIQTITNNAIIKIAILQDKYSRYLEIIEGKSKFDEILFSQYELLFQNILKIIEDKELSNNISKNNCDIFYDIHNQIFLILAHHKLIL